MRLLTLELWLYFNGLNLASDDTRSWCPLQSPNIWQRTMKYKTVTNNFMRNEVLNRTSYDSLSILHIILQIPLVTKLSMDIMSLHALFFFIQPNDKCTRFCPILLFQNSLASKTQNAYCEMRQGWMIFEQNKYEKESFIPYV